jgi:3-dehydroquinate synthase
MSVSSAAPASQQIPVHTASGDYVVHIEAGASVHLAALLDRVHAPARRFIVSCPPVWRLHGATFESLSTEPPILIPDGERHKRVATVGRIYDALVRAGADRATTIVAVGGGVVGDVAGFAAATFLRGVPVVQVPTTLLAQVDSAIGGKVGVNHALGKNLIGAFHQPLAVAIDPDLLVTLPRRELRAGLYEVVKYGVIASRPLFDRLSGSLAGVFKREAALLAEVIAESCRIKASVVGADEREAGPRRALNFGHTIGHALEALTHYKRFRHGEAVAYGMLAAGELAVARGAMAAGDRDALRDLITRMGPLPAVADLSAAEAVEATGRDKKVVGGRLHFVLPTAIGATTTVTDVTSEELRRAAEAVGLRP